MSEILSPLAYQLGIGAIGGFIVGFALKKLSKLVAIVIGLFILALIYLSTQGIISINYGALFAAVRDLFGLAEGAFSWLIGILSILPFLGSFIIGFLLSFKIG